MSTDIIIVGANGRMGRTISGLAAADPEYRLAGLVDSAKSGRSGRSGLPGGR